MNESDAGEVYEEALNAWESGDTDSFIDLAGAFNEWLIDEGAAPMMPEDWYMDDVEAAEAMWDWIDSLSHDEREAFFGY